jgi:heme/copper-type cytochrome/quinol oxidase subunit 3
MFLAAEMMFFIGLAGSYIVLRSASPMMFESQSMKLKRSVEVGETVVLLGSSVTMMLAVSAARLGKNRRVVGMIALTVLLGFGFLFVGSLQPIGDMRQNRFWASYALLTGAHWAHLAGGLVALMLLGVQASRGRMFAATTEYVGMYWHFVVGVWVVLFGFLYLM